MTRFLIMLNLLCSIQTLSAQNPQAYQLYNAQGKKVTFKKMLKRLAKTEVIFFGEYHNNPMSHWLQLEVTEALGEKQELVLGAEMFERDNHVALEQYLQGEIDQKALDTLARLWPNYKTDYKPLVDYAKEKGFPFIATNIPRKYASMVYKGGFEALEGLSVKEKNWLPPLPIPYDPNLPGYVKMLEMGGGHGGENLPKAQASKDASMGYFTAQKMQKGSIFIHYNGAFHSDYHGDLRGEGIIWYLKKERPDVRFLTITTVEQADISKLMDEHKGKADFIICVPENMTKTY